MDRGLSFDASSGVYGGEDSALEVGSGKIRGGRGGVLGAGVKRAESRRERHGGDSFLDTTDTNIKQQYHTVFCALNHTRSSYKLDIYVGSGLSFDASSEVFGGEDLALAVGSGKLKGGSGRVWKERMKSAGPHRERDGGDFFLATTDGIRQQYCTAFCALKHTRSSYKPDVYYMDIGLSFDASSEVYGGEDLALAVGIGKGRGGSSSVREEGVKRAGPQRERDGGDFFLATTDSIKQQYRTAFCALKHTRGSYKPAIYVDIGLSFDASLEVYGGGGLGPCGWKWQG